MRIEYQGKITVADVRRAIFLNYAPAMLWLNGFLLAGVVLGVAYFVFSGSLPPAYLPLLLFVLIVLAAPYYQPFLSARSAEKPGSLYRHPIHGVIDEHGVVTDNGETHIETPWDSYTHYKQAKEMLMLYKGRYCVNIFTPALFADRQTWEAFVAAVGERLPRG
ncbi:MAG: YcxB family protein [Anaerolineales bacterium]